VQATCPQCSNPILVDDAKVPATAFSVKCPKCSNVLRLPGKQGAGAAPAPAAAPAVEAPAPKPMPAAEAAASTQTEEMRTQMIAQVRREMSLGDAKAPTAGRALVALPDRALAGVVAGTLTRNGFAVDTLEDWEEGARLLEQGIYQVVVTARSSGAAGKGESLYQRLNRLNPEGRRRLFVVLVGEEFKSGDGTQAFVTLGDLVLHPRELSSSDTLLRNTLSERNRLWQTFLDARRRFEASA
jgi:predicted Zn finger-like uncharacterized protein